MDPAVDNCSTFAAGSKDVVWLASSGAVVGVIDRVDSLMVVATSAALLAFGELVLRPSSCEKPAVELIPSDCLVEPSNSSAVDKLIRVVAASVASFIVSVSCMVASRLINSTAVVVVTAIVDISMVTVPSEALLVLGMLELPSSSFGVIIVVDSNCCRSVELADS